MSVRDFCLTIATAFIKIRNVVSFRSKIILSAHLLSIRVIARYIIVQLFIPKALCVLRYLKNDYNLLEN